MARNHLATTSTCSSDVCNRVAREFNRTESLTTVDLVSRYPLGKDTDLFLRATKLLDQQKMVVIRTGHDPTNRVRSRSG